MNCWEILGIEPTEEHKAIKRAYARLIKQYNPVDYPDKFQDINAAYQQALNWQFHSQEEATPEQISDTPHSDAKITENNANQSPEPALESDPGKEESDELYQMAQSFMEALEHILETPNLRKDKKHWDTLLSQENLRSLELRRLISFSVFGSLSHYYLNQQEQVHGAYIPKEVLPGIAHVFDWSSSELELAKHFTPDEIDAVFIHAFGEKAVYVNNTSFQWFRLFKNLALYAFWVILLFGLMYFFTSDQKENTETIETVEKIRKEPYWDTDLEVCNEIDKPDTDPSFHQCLDLAISGRVYAQMRVAWLYFESEEEDHMQESYKWMMEAGEYLKEPLLLSKIILFRYGSTDDDKQSGYKGIVKLSNRGYSGADAYLATLYSLELNLAERMANPIWLIEKAYKRGDGFVSPMDMIKIYSNGIGTSINKGKATNIMKEYAEGNFPISANNVAWFIATTANMDLESPDYAVQLAENVTSDDRFKDSYVYVDTLAAAYAAAGKFDKAVSEQERAIRILEASGSEDQKRELDSFYERLEGFRHEKLPIYDDIKVDETAFFENMKNGLERTLLNVLRYATNEPN